ncbi:uncharacterized protein MELLADRAFT_112647 [Melampsora larici-populina 98AG31]|uniref:Uncharacterized protein n=1 Tax=Melampsora larici-populina (strain 98AG31 / pathotype 3-4-7) TaxID=747676 RepID=F4S754_MELLP|nr:uncharacterized protein MELLADRAFT_112647 [Melampsora larici-populina 98AG31]EGF99527.1 hypothetical protein MELLADRAFT_112647 [Melampsora larici-populina 98AG31]
MQWATQEHDRLWVILNHLKDDVHPDSELLQSFMNHEILQLLSTAGRIQAIKGLLHNSFVKMSTLALYWDDKVMEVIMNTSPQLGDLELMTLWKTQHNRIAHLRASGCGSSRHGDFEHLFEPIRLDEERQQERDELMVDRQQELPDDILDRQQEIPDDVVHPQQELPDEIEVGQQERPDEIEGQREEDVPGANTLFMIDEDDIDDAEWENRIDAGMLTNMMQNVGLEYD